MTLSDFVWGIRQAFYWIFVDISTHINTADDSILAFCVSVKHTIKDESMKQLASVDYAWTWPPNA